MSTATATRFRKEYVPELPTRVKRFLWLSTGMFSAAGFALAFVDYLLYGSYQGGGSNFIAALLSAGVFWISDTLGSVLPSARREIQRR